jgi:hypothetical protein
MKALVNALSVVAIANLLALLCVGFWLYGTGRLNTDRVERTRDLFVEPYRLVQARQEREQLEAEAEAARIAAEQGPDGPPISAAESLAVRLAVSDLDRQRVERLRREVQDLQRSLRTERRLLDEERAAFETEREQFEQMRERLAELEGGEQFRKALASLEGMKPDDARVTLESLIAAGEIDTVVGYLDAMQDRTRTKLMSSFVGSDQQELAAQLLEALRVRGVETAAR